MMYPSQPIGQPDPPPDPDPGDVQYGAIHEPTELDRILADPVAQYRCKQLLDGGLTLPQARTLALDTRVDLHFVLYTLIGRGCSPDVAFDIASFA